jgi:acyl-CoA thioesterase YciA
LSSSPLLAFQSPRDVTGRHPEICSRDGIAARSTDDTAFVGDEVSFYGELIRTGRTSMTVRIEAWRRHLPSDETRKVTEAIFTYVAIGEDRRPRRLPAAV